MAIITATDLDDVPTALYLLGIWTSLLAYLSVSNLASQQDRYASADKTCGVDIHHLFSSFFIRQSMLPYPRRLQSDSPEKQSQQPVTVQEQT
jgi:hypothetical protein